jgi:hypothetical protein
MNNLSNKQVGSINFVMEEFQESTVRRSRSVEAYWNYGFPSKCCYSRSRVLTLEAQEAQTDRVNLTRSTADRPTAAQLKNAIDSCKITLTLMPYSIRLLVIARPSGLSKWNAATIQDSAKIKTEFTLIRSNNKPVAYFQYYWLFDIYSVLVIFKLYI